MQPVPLSLCPLLVPEAGNRTHNHRRSGNGALAGTSSPHLPICRVCYRVRICLLEDVFVAVVVATKVGELLSD